MNRSMPLLALAALGLGLGAAGCERAASDDAAPRNVSTTTVVPPPAFRPVNTEQIPEGPLGDAVRRGKLLVERTYEELPDHVGNELHCTSCHIGGGTVPNAGPWVGLPGLFPEYRSRSGRVNTLAERVNDCFERSMNGTALDPTGDDMNAILAYMSYISRGVESGKSLPGRGFKKLEDPPTPDRQHGEELYATACASCHGADGAGQKPGGVYAFPALWGDQSFNVGAGMARLDTAAAFIHGNMPLGAGGTLSPQDAYDLADFIIHQPRPDFAGKVNDWPKGGKPRDARY